MLSGEREAQVGSGRTSGGSVVHNDHYCWTRPEDIDYDRTVNRCDGGCSDLAAEMSAALASASIVFKDNRDYSKKLVHGAKTLFTYANAMGRCLVIKLPIVIWQRMPVPSGVALTMVSLAGTTNYPELRLVL
ncbi:unnamed protein product [Eruca vesicaria subsp. sativa]|uniref:cellulase n=1 Tax=Eruca vesicaria subsp. sativa TaxID=29727 RepID=A0ABC8JE99_ERUVS|nr:unnamed protein product [Eruca vesicaria subsp. sativa]